MVIQLTAQNHAEVVEKAKKLVIIDVSASWCGPCQLMKPVFHQLASELGSECVFAEINVDDAQDLAIKYNVVSVPTFLFIKNGTVVHRQVGYMQATDLKKQIAALAQD